MRSTSTVTAALHAGATETTAVTEFGAAVLRWCEDNGVNQVDLADEAGLHRSTLSRVIHGQRDATEAMVTALDGVMRTGGRLAEVAERSNQHRATTRTIPAARRRPVPAQLPAVCGTLHGREQELAALAACGPAPGLRLCLDGLPGVGKTTLAVHHAHRLSTAYRSGTVWADLRGHQLGGPADPSELLGDFLATLGLEVPDGLEARKRAWRSATWASRLLIVLDDARSAEQITPLLPGGTGCAVLITSRYRLSSVMAGAGVQQFTVAPLRRAQSIELLRARLGNRVDAEPATAGRVAELCADVPRAVSLAAERLSVHPEISLDVLLDEHEDRWALTEIADEPGCSMRATLRRFYNALPAQHRRAWRVLGAAGGRMTSAELAENTGWAPGDTRQVLDGLVLAHLLTRRETTWEMNELIAAWGAHLHTHNT
ncbi:NB-ARC domain-containing protein [Saccharopolyspora sp. ID03-671]|uniref:NB-ARC domain-containing protein n=1 Tax=Saccharopolyspora sp. ID03-671 TaxID=3073066 RepID=UPI0032442424